MQGGIVSLKPLYDFVREHPGDEALNGQSKIGREYGFLAADVVGSIADKQGFYLWGYYQPKGLWHNVYLGKAGFGKTAHLRARILEELKDERSALWRTVLTRAALLECGARHYPGMWKVYHNHWERALNKQKSTHVVWVADHELPNADVANIESDLIETLNPTANIKRPTPPDSLQGHTRDVIRLFREKIHSARGERYPLVLKHDPNEAE